MRKVAANISKDVKKFWIKIEKLASSFILFNIIDYCKTCIRIFLFRRNLAILFWFEEQVVYKHQLELEERKKKALDKQLDFLLGQTERYVSVTFVHLTCRSLILFLYVYQCPALFLGTIFTRYSTMLAENLVDMPYPQKLENGTLQTNQSSHPEVGEENVNAAITDDPGL